MKTSIKLTSTKAATVGHTNSGHVLIGMEQKIVGGDRWELFAELTPDQASVLVFALEQALNVIDLNHRKELENIRAGGVRCHGDACAAGQLPCPTARACGVAA